MNCPRLSGRQKLASSARHVPSPESVVVFFATSLPNGQSLSREPQNTVSCISITWESQDSLVRSFARKQVKVQSCVPCQIACSIGSRGSCRIPDPIPCRGAQAHITAHNHHAHAESISVGDQVDWSLIPISPKMPPSISAGHRRKLISTLF